MGCCNDTSIQNDEQQQYGKFGNASSYKRHIVIFIHVMESNGNEAMATFLIGLAKGKNGKSYS